MRKNKVWLILIITALAVLFTFANYGVFAQETEEAKDICVAFTDGDGLRLHALNGVKADVFANVSYDGKAGFSALSALYDSAGKLLEVVLKTGEDAKAFPVCNGEIKDGNYIKLYIFNSTDELKPIVKEKTIGYVKGDGEKLLSGNDKGSLISEDTERLFSDAKYFWETEGKYSADDEILASDKNGVMNNGETDDCITASKTEVNSNALIYDLNDVFSVSSVKVWTYCSSKINLSSFDVYASMDGENYNFIESKDNTFTSGNRYRAVTLNLASRVNARLIKLVLNKDSGLESSKLAEAAIFGYEAETPVKLDYSYYWNTVDPFATWKDIAINDPGNLILRDGNEETFCETETDYASAVVDLGNNYSPHKIWVKGENISSAEIKYSIDGNTYFSGGYFPYNDGEINALAVAGQNARYIRINFIKTQTAKTMKINDLSVYARHLYENTPKNSKPEQVSVKYKLKSNNILYLDWSDYDKAKNSADGFVVYIEKNYFSSALDKQPKAFFEGGNSTRKTYTDAEFVTCDGLEPEQTYYVAVAPVSESSGQRMDVTPVKITTNDALGSDKPDALFCFDEYPYGGGVHTAHESEDKNIDVKLTLLSELENVNRLRWFGVSESITQRYGTKGLCFHLLGAPSSRANENNIWSFEAVNEPEEQEWNKKDYKFEDAIAAVKNNYEKGKNDARNALSAPSIAGTEDKRIEWLDKFYRAENGEIKNYFNVMNIHPYCKRENGVYKGLAVGAPEQLPDKLDILKNKMATFGDEEKPIIYSELGWSTHTTPTKTAIVAVDYDVQANYVARAYILAKSGGIKQVYWYAFQDEGIDRKEQEENFGLVDWYGVPKKSYYSFYTMVRALKDADYTRQLDFVEHPNYAYEFYDETNRRYVTAIWAADEKERELSLRVDFDAKEVSVQSSKGELATVPVVNGVINIKIDGSPKYIYTSRPIKDNVAYKVLSGNKAVDAYGDTYSGMRDDSANPICIDSYGFDSNVNERQKLIDGKILKDNFTAVWNLSECGATFDLGKEAFVTRVDVWHIYDILGKSGAKRNLKSVKIELSSDGSNYTSVGEFTANPYMVENGNFYNTICSFEPRKARYVKLTAYKDSSCNQMYFGEVVIIGS